MGQFGNQPDFITEVKSLTVSDTINSTTFLNGSAIYVGNSTTGTDIKVIMVGVTAAGGGVPTATDAITIKGVQAGSKLPFIVDYVLATGTTATELIMGK